MLELKDKIQVIGLYLRRRLPQCLFLLAAVILGAALFVPLADIEIEPQAPNQRGALGTIYATEIRGVLLLALSLALTAVLASLQVSKRFGGRQRKLWGYATLALALACLGFSIVKIIAR